MLRAAFCLTEVLVKVWETASFNYPAYSMKAGQALSTFQYLDPAAQQTLLNAFQQVGLMNDRLEQAQETATTVKATIVRDAVIPVAQAQITLDRALALNFPHLSRGRTSVVTTNRQEALDSEQDLSFAHKKLLAKRVASRIRNSRDPVPVIANYFRKDFEVLGMVRKQSLDSSMVRRFQAFCSEFVYGVLIPENELRPRIRSGKRTGGRPQNH